MFHFVNVNIDHRTSLFDIALSLAPPLCTIEVSQPSRLRPTAEKLFGGLGINELKTIYTIPFTKDKANELLEFAADSIGFTVQNRGMGGRRYTCSLEEFRDLSSYDELIALKRVFTFTVV